MRPISVIHISTFGDSWAPLQYGAPTECVYWVLKVQENWRTKNVWIFVK